MAKRFTIDSNDLRARLRPQSHTTRQADFVPRSVIEPSHKLFQDVAQVADFTFVSPASQSLPEPMLKVEAPPKAPLTVTAPSIASTSRLILPVKPHKTEASKVLRRESFILPKNSSSQTQFESQSDWVIDSTASDSNNQAATDSTAAVYALVQPTSIVPKGMIATMFSRIKQRHMVMPPLQQFLTGTAALVLIIGLGVTVSGLRANSIAHAAAARASIATANSATTDSKSDKGGPSDAPSTAPVDADTLRAYQVSPDAARYIRIKKLGVFARVLQVGLTKDGALATPTNVFDAAWYKSSAKPGKPGATLIDGHVSSWTTNGVFYGIKNLVAGDQIEIERGDGQKLTYSVVKKVAYDADSVDMASLLRPINPSQSGLNLITCGGKYDKKSGEFTQRVAIYAVLN